MASSSSEIRNCNTPDAFFLRPFLTREEYDYWKSHFCLVPSSRSSVRASNPQDTTALTSGHHMTSSVTNTTVAPCCDERHQTGVPVVHGLSANCCSNTRCSEMSCFPENIPSSIVNNRETINAKVSGSYPCSTNSSVKENASLEKGNPGNPLCLEHLAPCTSRTDQNEFEKHHEISTNGCDTTEGYFVRQEVEPTKLKRSYFVYESSGRKPSPLTSSGHQEVYPRTGATVVSDSMSVYDLHSELRSINSFPAKRKSIGTSKNENFPQRKKKRPCGSDEVNGTQQDQEPIKSVPKTETRNAHQSKRPRIRGCRCHESRDILKSREITMPPVQDCVEQSIATTISGGSTSGYKPGSETLKETQQTTTDSTENHSDAAFKSRVLKADDQIPNDLNKSLERKSIDKVIKTTRPVQRKLMTNDRTGGCAFDHDSFPKLIGVLSPSAIATVMSSLAK